jgi:hypothetical protein
MCLPCNMITMLNGANQLFVKVSGIQSHQLLAETSTLSVSCMDNDTLLNVVESLSGKNPLCPDYKIEYYLVITYTLY